MSKRKVAVIGGGNGSYATAAHLALAGHSLRMWVPQAAKYDRLKEDRAITWIDSVGSRTASLELVTSDPGLAVKGAEMVISPLPAFSQPDIAARIGPHLEDGQLLLLSPGSLGSVLFSSLLRERGISRDLVLAEPGTLPYLARKSGPTAVEISARTVRQPVGVFPAARTEEAVERLAELYPEVHPVENVLSVALLNVGPIIHSVLVLLNLGAIEHSQAWDIHNEGTTPSVKKLILALDRERIGLRRALGFASHHYPFSDHYDQTAEEEWMYGRKGHTELVKSENWREPLSLEHRYVQEDVKCNLALFVSLGRLAGTGAPLAASILNLYGALLEEDLSRTGRTLDSLGLGGRSREEIDRLLEEGL